MKKRVPVNVWTETHARLHKQSADFRVSMSVLIDAIVRDFCAKSRAERIQLLHNEPHRKPKAKAPAVAEVAK